MESPLCDLCGGNKPEVLYCGKDWKQPIDLSVRLVRCQECGLIYLSPRPDVQEISKYYSEDYPCYRQAIEDEPSAFLRFIRHRNQTNRRKIVEQKLGRTKGDVLDVGCSTGLFLFEMQRAGWHAQGVEPNAFAAEYARQRFNLEIFEGYLEEADFTVQSFDLITYWDVLEHTFSPLNELKISACLLKPGGIIVLNIPNWNSIGRRVFGPHWVGYDPPRHLYVFSLSTLCRLLEAAGFNVISARCLIPSFYAFKISLWRWLSFYNPTFAIPVDRFLNIPGMRILFEPGFLLLQALKRGDIITVFACKKDKI